MIYFISFNLVGEALIFFSTKFKLYAYVNYLSNLEGKYVFYMYRLPGSDAAHHMGKT